MDKLLEVLGSIGFDWKVALANFVNFLIILFLLNTFIFPKIRSALAQRRKIIEKGLEDAQRAETARIMAEEREKEVLRQAQLKANEILAQANHKGNELLKKAEEKAESAAKQLVQKAELEIDRQKAQSQKDVEKHAVDMVVSGIESVLMKELNETENDTFVKKILSRVKKTI